MTTIDLATAPQTAVPNPFGPTIDLDVVIVNYRTPTLLTRCLRSWQAQAEAHAAAGIRIGVTVVDVDPDYDSLGEPAFDYASWGVQALVLPWNAGYSGACNRAALITDAPIVSFWNADTALINGDAIPTMMRHFADHPDDCHIAGPLQTDDQGRVTHAGIFGGHEAPQQRDFMKPVHDGHRDVRRCITIAGSAYFIRRPFWDKLRDCALFQEEIDPGNPGAMLRTPHYFEETWVSYHARAHAGRVWYVGSAEVQHLWNKAPHDDVADTSRLFAASQPIFQRACDTHNIPHD